MQAGVTIILYGYMDMNTINKGKRDEIIKNCYWKLICKQKVKNKRGEGGNSVPRASVQCISKSEYDCDVRYC
jgi:hypothetical protein